MAAGNRLSLARILGSQTHPLRAAARLCKRCCIAISTTDPFQSEILRRSANRDGEDLSGCEGGRHISAMPPTHRFPQVPPRW